MSFSSNYLYFSYTQYTACLFGGGGVLLYWKKMWYFRGVWANYLFQPLRMFILYDNGVLIWKFLLIVCSRCSLIRFKGCLNVHVIHLLD